MNTGIFEPTLHFRRIQRAVNGEVVEVLQQLWVNAMPPYALPLFGATPIVPEEWRDVPLVPEKS